MRKNSILGLSLVFAASVFGQTNILNASIPEEIGLKTEAQMQLAEDKPLEYGYVDDRDILYSKIVWEKIVLDEKVNFPYLFPINETNIDLYRRSLFTTLWQAVRNGDVTAYTDSYFTEPVSIKQVKSALVYEKIDDSGTDYMNANGLTEDEVLANQSLLPEEYWIREEIGPADIKEFRIKGMWYFDKRQGELKYRLLALCPAAPEARFKNSDNEDDKTPIELFWVYMPEARQLLTDAKSFNNKNSAKPISFDHLLNSRRFNATIYKEANVYGDREIERYIPGNALMQLLESERIKDNIRNFEQDMWSY